MTAQTKEWTKRMKEEILASLKHHYQNMESNKYFAVATVLDPRFKDKVFSSMSFGMIAKQMLTSLYKAEAQKDDILPIVLAHNKL